MITSPDPQVQERIEEEGLRFYNDSSPGFFRQKSGKNFHYYDLDGKKIKEDRILERINSLIIPPAWKDVWVSPKSNGHLQATGIDEKGRKQYIYHPDWVKACQEDKFAKLIDFGLSLPKIRSKVRHNLDTRELNKERLLATIVWLLEHTFIRVGNDEYAKQNNSFGLTTLRNRHVDVRGETITFNFRGKSGVDHILQISNPVVSKTIKKCIELPGYELFKYIDEDGDRHVVDSADVNQFLKDVTDDDFSAKDFRTWGATTLSATNFYETGPWENKKVLPKTIRDNVKNVASHLGNTVSVCKNYYIHPTVIKAYEKNLLIPHFEKFKGPSKKPGLSWDEYAVIELLQKY